MSQPMPTAPRSLRSPEALDERPGRLFDTHVRPLNEWVQAIRAERGLGEDTPWFDPDSGGVDAKVLLLFEAPGARSTSSDGPRAKSKGSGIISPDNNDATAATTFELREQAGLDRRQCLYWYIVPWYLGTDTKIHNPKQAQLKEAAPRVHELLVMLPALRCVILVGAAAQDGWEMAMGGSATDALTVLGCPHPSPRNLNSRPHMRDEILQTFTRVARCLP